MPWPPLHSAVTLEERPPTQQHNFSRYEYIVYDEPEPRRRVARLMRSLKRLDVASAGIYHPTLVPMEDKRIAGVSGSLPAPLAPYLPVQMPHFKLASKDLALSLMNVQLFAARAIKFNGSPWQRGNGRAIDLCRAIKMCNLPPPLKSGFLSLDN